MTVIICGTRQSRLRDPFRASLAVDARVAQLPPGTTIVHGDAPGIDRIAGAAAERHGHTAVPVPAEWEKYRGRKPNPAGVIRNKKMLADHRPDLVIGFWDGVSPGTEDMLMRAHNAGVQIEVIRL